MKTFSNDDVVIVSKDGTEDDSHSVLLSRHIPNTGERANSIRALIVRVKSIRVLLGRGIPVN